MAIPVVDNIHRFTIVQMRMKNPWFLRDEDRTIEQMDRFLTHIRTYAPEFSYPYLAILPDQNLHLALDPRACIDDYFLDEQDLEETILDLLNHEVNPSIGSISVPVHSYIDLHETKGKNALYTELENSFHLTRIQVPYFPDSF